MNAGGKGRGGGEEASAAEALHPRIAAAARGELPGWARVSPGRRAHMERVAGLLTSWARSLGLGRRDELRWRAAGWLHDALREADPETLRDEAPPELRALPGPLLHGPVAARRLRHEGVEDEALLRAVAFHTVGDPELDALGLALFCADFLDPGREFREAWRAGLRERMPGALEEVAREVTAARIRHRLDGNGAVELRTARLWNRLVAREGEGRR